MRVRFAPQAIQDLRDIRVYLGARTWIGADNVRLAIVAAIELLEEFPDIARDTDIEDVRVISVVQYPYLIYHRRVGKAVVILHIRHSSRDIPGRDELL